MKDKIFKFPTQESEGTVGSPAGWTVVAGTPEARGWRYYTSDDGSALAGLWQCTPGTFNVAYDKWEFCHIISGACTITPENRSPIKLGPGDGFLLEPGFKGRWEVTETMRKHFVFKIDANVKTTTA
jgi:uncharacterized cupin superfamily protein